MSIPKAPNELEIVRTTWNQFEIVLAGQKGFKLSIKPIPQLPSTGLDCCTGMQR
jgi:hypothetical protein